MPLLHLLCKKDCENPKLVKGERYWAKYGRHEGVLYLDQERTIEMPVKVYSYSVSDREFAIYTYFERPNNKKDPQKVVKKKYFYGETPDGIRFAMHMPFKEAIRIFDDMDYYGFSKFKNLPKDSYKPRRHEGCLSYKVYDQIRDRMIAGEPCKEILEKDFMDNKEVEVLFTGHIKGEGGRLY